MNIELQFITSAGLAVLLLEGVKWVIRKLILKNPEFDFSEKFYLIMTPVMTYLAGPLLALLAVGTYTFPTDWLSFGQQFLVVILNSLFTTLIYNTSLKPLKDYAERLALES